MRAGDGFELFLLELAGQHVEGRRVVHRPAGRIVQAEHLSGQRQRVPADGIHDQEFFFNTKSTHVLSVTDESDGEGPLSLSAAQRRLLSRLGGPCLRR
jgi:hypothetical protein